MFKSDHLIITEKKDQRPNKTKSYLLNYIIITWTSKCQLHHLAITTITIYTCISFSLSEQRQDVS